MHAKPDLRVFLKWMLAGSGSVITDVITLRKPMPSTLILLALVCLPFLLGAINQRLSKPLSGFIVFVVTCFFGFWILLSLVSSWHSEYRSAILPFDTNSDGVLNDTERTLDLMNTVKDTVQVGPFTLVALAPVAGIWFLTALAIQAAAYNLGRSPTGTLRPAGESELTFSCQACLQEITATKALAGCQGKCPTCNAEFRFPSN